MLSLTADPAFSFNTSVALRPAAVAYPRNVDEVIAAVRHAREHGLRVAPQATGHNVSAYGTLDDALLVDVRHLQDIAIDPRARRVRVGAGVKWERVAPTLSEHGLAGLHGSSPDVGIAGYSLGGGMGWLARRYGLQANSVTALELVLADGRHVRTDATHEPDLFWALRGGNGNFGVVTAIDFTVYPLAELYAGTMFFPFERAADVLHTWARMLGRLPDELMTWASLLHLPDAPWVPAHARGGSFAIVSGAFLGEEREGRELLRPIRDLGPAIDTFAMVPPVGLSELHMDPPEPVPGAGDGMLLSDLPADGIDALLEAAGPGTGSPLVSIEVRHLGGAAGRADPENGARAAIDAAYILFAVGTAIGPEMMQAVERRIDEVEAALRRWDAGRFLTFTERPVDPARMFADEAYRRLREIKAKFDPHNVIQANHEISPAELS